MGQEASGLWRGSTGVFIMSGRLKGKAALITGAGGGIGAATSALFCAEGAAVMLVDRDAEALERTAAEIRRKTPNAVLQTLAAERSEEHTSELQSLMRIPYAVFC